MMMIWLGNVYFYMQFTPTMEIYYNNQTTPFSGNPLYVIVELITFLLDTKAMCAAFLIRSPGGLFFYYYYCLIGIT